MFALFTACHPQVPPQKPFLRMNYADAVKYCNQHNIYKDEEKKEHFKFGDVCACVLLY
jgi:hypothetical protein